MHRPIAVLFDAYGTLFDVQAVAATLDQLRPGRGAEAAFLLRARQIDYTRLRTLSGRYADFWVCTQDALSWVNAKLHLALTSDETETVMSAYAELTAHPDAVRSVTSLRAMGLPLGILSNGTPSMLASAIAAAGLDGQFQWVLSVDVVQRYKTAPEAYQLGVDAVGAPARDILFVSSNGWDAACATWFGYQTYWVNRSGEPAEVLCAPTMTGATLDNVVGWLATG